MARTTPLVLVVLALAACGGADDGDTSAGTGPAATTPATTPADMTPATTPATTPADTSAGTSAGITSDELCALVPEAALAGVLSGSWTGAEPGPAPDGSGTCTWTAGETCTLSVTAIPSLSSVLSPVRTQEQFEDVYGPAQAVPGTGVTTFVSVQEGFVLLLGTDEPGDRQVVVGLADRDADAPTLTEGAATAMAEVMALLDTRH